MTVLDTWYQWDQKDLLLNVRVQPKARHDEIVGPYSNALKVRITAPPVDGIANSHLIRFLAKTFGVPISQVSLLSGKTGRDKRLRIQSPVILPAEISQ